MDSVSQFALGAAVGVAVMGRRTAVWKAALWGGVCGTLPDLDVFIDHGDPVRNMTLHRTESHALPWLTLASLPIAGLVAAASRELDRWRRWWLAVWLALITHPLLDGMTVYGTQLWLPLTDTPYGVGSVFIIDPLYTVPLIVGVVAALRMRSGRGFAWNAAGLVLSTAYLGWGVLAQQQVRNHAEEALRAQGIAAERVLVTPTAFNSLLWRVVAMSDDGHWHEGFRSLLDGDGAMRFDRFDQGRPLYEALRGSWSVDRIAWFSRGFFKLEQRDDRVIISDLRMGQEPNHIFAYEVARLASPPQPVTPLQIGQRGDIGAALAWQWRRMWGHDEPPPR
jgi:inner membrane protein